MRTTICLLLLFCVVRAEKTPYESWADQVVTAVEAGDADRTMVLFDFRALLDTATLGGPQDVRTGFTAGAMKAMRQKGGVLHEIIPDVARGGRFDLLRITEREGQPCARFRFASAVGGINYLDVKLRLDDTGAVRGIDMYNQLSGEWMSATMRRFFLAAVRLQKQSLWEKLVGGGGKEWLEGAEGLQRMSRLMNAGLFADAMKVYRALPDVVRKQKSTMVVGIRVAEQLGEKEYAEAIDEYLALYPDDPSAHLISIDAHFMKGRFDAALASVDALDKSVGGDPYLGILKANLLLSGGKPDKARESARAALKVGPDWTDGYFALLDIELQTRRFEEVVRLLNLLEDRFGFAFEDLTQHDAYAEFVKSPAYEIWLARKKTD